MRERYKLTEARFDLPGLHRPVEVIVDAHGIAHIRAEARDDLFFAQGWNAARDRLWQIDLWRKRGLGLLAADFGPGYLEQDRAARQFLYRGDMASEWAAYGADAEETCAAFAAGINARIGQIEGGEAPLPREFQLMGTRPARWQASDVVRVRSHCLTRNGVSEIIRARILAQGSPALDSLRRRIEPQAEATRVDGLDLASIPLAALDRFMLATAPVTFSRQRLDARIEDAPSWCKTTPAGEVVRAVEAAVLPPGADGESEGSNNWAVGPQRTATGRPIMASDPHRLHALPSLRYMVHLTMPGLDVIGMGEPCVPGVSLGHNDAIAWSLTIFGADQEDVFVYDTDPADPGRYRYGEGWEEFTETVERFEVRGADPVELPLRFTRHGPLLLDDRANARAYALRTVWTDPGMAPYMASLRVMRARNHAEYVAALAHWGTPSVNHIYADAGGRIAWHPAGATPIRPNWNGLLPVPGDGRFEWAGYADPATALASVDPARGFVVTANEMNLPPDYDGPAIGYEWLDPSRSQRIHAVLDSQPRHDIAASCRLQNDTHSRIGQRTAAVLAGLGPLTGAAEAARAMLAGWDGGGGADSAPAALFELWLTRHLQPALAGALGADAELLPLLAPYDNQTVIAILQQPQDWLGADATAVRDDLLQRTLAAAWEEMSDRLGRDPAAWRWGDLHGLTLAHPLAGLFPDEPGLTLPRLAVGGGAASPNYGPYRAGDFGVTTGPSLRLVMDVGAWDDSVFVALAGQSGDPASPHFADMAEDWRDGRYRPLRYSAAAVDAGAEAVIHLRPAGL